MKTLLLAGTPEARAIADRLASDGAQAVASLVGVDNASRTFPIPTRRGGFGGEVSHERFLRDGGFDAVIDATPPFSAKISARSFAIARRLKLPYLRVLRPMWQAQDGDLWHSAASEADIAKLIPKKARVFLSTEAAALDKWADLASGRTLFCRRADRTDEPFPFDGGWIIGQPPFVLAYELRLLKTYSIEWVVSKNSGGPARAILDAARALGRPVALLDRPVMMDCDHAQTVQEALTWLSRQSA
ncbi:precorrin-6A/cobalt-precorrin-6A reductase [Aliiroseovarius sediminis]|uniref:precorrin-6A/cobalt-precorrin-6A reductase n=1 Tax=Aliiroseovarius sediminis TaxID=2925839 RepID=UPI001F5944F5|nr:precorrin-6A/cobalt-precorrin-6A reductase [uncultured Aliiroseovarius sp.]MCI2393585.1 precorrin-6A/cobalt-precorrin-6A reductase [Aliiroseovarius sediminis]